MTATNLILSSWQRQTIADIGIDAWYLEPVSRVQTRADKEHAKLIGDLVGVLNEPQPESRLQKNSVTSAATTELSDSHVEESIVIPPAQKTRHVMQTPTPIMLPTTENFALPSDSVIGFFPSPLTVTHWGALQAACINLANEADKTCFMGEGSQTADDIFILPPPEPIRKNHSPSECSKNVGLSDKEQNLLSEMLASIQLDWEKTYRTRLIKHPTDFGQNPDDELLERHLPLLATELALIQPKRVWLCGTASCQVLLQTKAPLSALIQYEYELLFKNISENNVRSDIICLPTPDYLLALPAEKGKVWQQIKSLS